MPFATNSGIRIYYESIGDGPPVVMVHGLWDDLRCWYEAGYVDALRPDYRLILFDARGHGASDKPHDPAEYGVANLCGDVGAVLDAAGIDHAVFWGYSLGAKVGYALGGQLPVRLRALVMGRNGAQTPPPERVAQLVAAVTKGREAYEQVLNGLFGPDTSGFKHRWMSGDLKAYAAASQAVPGFPLLTADGLAHFEMPCLLYAGDKDSSHDPAKQRAKEIPGAIFASLPGLNHITALTRDDLIVPHVGKFLAGIRTGLRFMPAGPTVESEPRSSGAFE